MAGITIQYGTFRLELSAVALVLLLSVVVSATPAAVLVHLLTALGSSSLLPVGPPAAGP